TLGSAKTQRPSITEGTQQQYQIAVTPGSTSLTATIGSPAVVGTDLDLVLYNCTTGSCIQAGISADGDSEESVTVPNPAPGVRVGRGDRREHGARVGQLVDGTGDGDGHRRPGRGPDPARSADRADRHRRHGRHLPGADHLGELAP